MDNYGTTKSSRGQFLNYEILWWTIIELLNPLVVNFGTNKSVYAGADPYNGEESSSKEIYAGWMFSRTCLFKGKF